jgi:hypothetical protein
MKNIDLERMNPVIANSSIERFSPTGMYPRMIRTYEPNESRLARRIKSGKTNKKIRTKNK